MISKILWPFFLQLLGVVVIIAEFILPSMGLLTVIAIVLFGYSLYLVFTQISPSVGFVFLAVDACIIPVLVIIGIRLLAASPVTLRKSLSRADGAQSQPPEWAQLTGTGGTTVTDLHPSGNAVIDGRRYDVMTRGEFIDRGTDITVLSVDGNRIVVKKTDSANY